MRPSAAGRGLRRAGARSRRPRDRGAHAVSERDLRPESGPQRPPAHRASAAPGLVRLVVFPARQGPLPRQHLLAARQLFDRAAEARDEDPEHRGAEAAGSLQEDAEREERAHPHHGRHRLRQDDVAGRAAQRDQRHQVSARRDARGSGRVRASQPQGDVQPARARPRLRLLRQRPARGAPAGAQDHPRR